VDDAQPVRQQHEIDRLTDELAGTFRRLSVEQIRERINQEFSRRDAAPVQDFGSIFAERSLRREAKPPRAY
jgi:hypothetical protein